MELVHQHTILRINTKFFFENTKSMNKFLRNLVKHLKMEIIIPPRSAFCGQPGNTGLTGQVGLVTSHATIHSWDEFYFHEMDIYSCREYNIAELLHFLSDIFKPFSIEYINFNRDTIKRDIINYL